MCVCGGGGGGGRRERAGNGAIASLFEKFVIAKYCPALYLNPIASFGRIDSSSIYTI